MFIQKSNIQGVKGVGIKPDKAGFSILDGNSNTSFASALKQANQKNAGKPSIFIGTKNNLFEEVKNASIKNIIFEKANNASTNHIENNAEINIPIEVRAFIGNSNKKHSQKSLEHFAIDKFENKDTKVGDKNVSSSSGQEIKPHRSNINSDEIKEKTIKRIDDFLKIDEKLSQNNPIPSVFIDPGSLSNSGNYRTKHFGSSDQPFENKGQTFADTNEFSLQILEQRTNGNPKRNLSLQSSQNREIFNKIDAKSSESPKQDSSKHSPGNDMSIKGQNNSQEIGLSKQSSNNNTPNQTSQHNRNWAVNTERAHRISLKELLNYQSQKTQSNHSANLQKQQNIIKNDLNIHNRINNSAPKSNSNSKTTNTNNTSNLEDYNNIIKSQNKPANDPTILNNNTKAETSQYPGHQAEQKPKAQ
ncbi:MAG: hypothetical protein ACLFSQ_10830, partial [Candidatus Zixiibacteriota bacterium]